LLCLLNQSRYVRQVGEVVLSDTWHQLFPQPDQLWLNGQINFGLTEVDRKDLSKTNSKLKGPIWNLRNLNDLSETNSKLKGPIWNIRNLKDLSETNMKSKGLGEVFDLNYFLLSKLTNCFPVILYIYLYQLKFCPMFFLY